MTFKECRRATEYGGDCGVAVFISLYLPIALSATAENVTIFFLSFELLSDTIVIAVATVLHLKGFPFSPIDQCSVPVNMNHQISDAAYKYPDACPKHGYNLEWRTCLRCDTIKLYNQSSIASFIDLGGKSSLESNRQYSEAMRSAVENLPTEYHHDSDSFDGPSNYSERLVLTHSDGMGVANDKSSKTCKRCNRLHENAKTKPGIEEGDVENEIEYLPLSDEMPQESQIGPSRRRDTNEKRRASDRHVSFAE